MKSILLAAILFLTTGGQMLSQDIQVGDVYIVTPSENNPKVEVIVGKIEPLSVGKIEPLSAVVPGGPEKQVLHLEIQSSEQNGPDVGHSPFDLEAIKDFLGDKVDQGRVLNEGFDEGYQTWRAAASEGKAGVFTINPADAYWMIVGVANE